VNNIPRFVPRKNYAESFGLQWNQFKRTQIDSELGSTRSRDRFNEETQWTKRELENKLVLDAGCGSGRFSEIALSLGGHLIAVDFSSAVDAASKNLSGKNALIIQGDLAKLPIANSSIDFIYCIGVLQHTSNPEQIIQELLRCLKPGGELALTFYENSSWHVKFYSKYLVRPLTKRLPANLLLKIIVKTSHFWFPITSILFRLPSPLGRIFRFMIPIANYVEFEYVNKQDAKDEAILDTFDMLSPAYDKPIRKNEIRSWISNSGISVKELEVKLTRGTLKYIKLY
jgi:SAM-dependent methyltransferase